MYAEFIALCASSTAVSNPKVLSINKISLSIVLGTPITDTFNRLLQHYREENISVHKKTQSSMSSPKIKTSPNNLLNYLQYHIIHISNNRTVLSILLSKLNYKKTKKEKSSQTEN